MRRRYFITSTGTGIGKSFITAGLVRQAQATNKSVAAYKPVISGFDPLNPAESDTGILLQSLGLPLTSENIAQISPFRYAAPLAPSMASRMEKRPLDFPALVAHGKQAIAGGEGAVFIEGVGGVMVPLDDRHTVLDWIEALGIEAVLVTGNYLGSISHTLTALSVLTQRRIPLFAIIVNESEESTVSMADTVDELARWTRLPLVPVARRRKGETDIAELKALLI